MYVITNVDAALDVGGGRVGVGAVVRNDRGVPIFAAGVCLIGGAESTKGSLFSRSEICNMIQDIKALLSVADERFLELRPKPNFIKLGEPRIAQWHKTMLGVENVRTVLNSAEESFDWCPYTKTLKNWNFPKFYAEKEIWVSVDPNRCEELESFARCLRVSELVSRGCVEHYFPHRVVMPFGLDQDLPA
ncbi:hypothetical protein EZV62_009038 [Acer yangbiense]|uniref:Aminotransferase-like plant mobile domain-containing protein n=1 Tax=Acer yangbiense TaxID=1000413 RepID=A0A5C7IER4_9ROSI|nr:hypothetical protein EZV62_009038 [Acer yangbiense]